MNNTLSVTLTLFGLLLLLAIAVCAIVGKFNR
jgi:hypothetical protein